MVCVNAFLSSGLNRETKERTHNTIELANDLEMMLEIHVTYLTTLFRIGVSAKGVAWSGVCPSLPLSPSVPYLKALRIII